MPFLRAEMARRGESLHLFPASFGPPPSRKRLLGVGDALDDADDELLGGESPVAAVLRVGDVVAAEEVVVLAENVVGERFPVEPRRAAVEGEAAAGFVLHERLVEPEVAQVERDLRSGPGNVERSEIPDRPAEKRVVERHGAQYGRRDRRVGRFGELPLPLPVADGAFVAVVPKVSVADRNAVARRADAAFGIDVVDAELDPVPVVTVRDVEDHHVVHPYLPQPRQPERMQRSPLGEIETPVDPRSGDQFVYQDAVAGNERGQHRLGRYDELVADERPHEVGHPQRERSDDQRRAGGVPHDTLPGPFSFGRVHGSCVSERGPERAAASSPRISSCIFRVCADSIFGVWSATLRAVARASASCPEAR